MAKLAENSFRFRRDARWQAIVHSDLLGLQLFKDFVYQRGKPLLSFYQ